MDLRAIPGGRAAGTGSVRDASGEPDQVRRAGDPTSILRPDHCPRSHRSSVPIVLGARDDLVAQAFGLPPGAEVVSALTEMAMIETQGRAETGLRFADQALALAEQLRPAAPGPNPRLPGARVRSPR